MQYVQCHILFCYIMRQVNFFFCVLYIIGTLPWFTRSPIDLKRRGIIVSNEVVERLSGLLLTEFSKAYNF